MDFIVVDHALSLLSQFPAHQEITLVRLSGQKHWRLLGGFRYLAALVMGWNKFSQWLETCLLMLIPYTRCIPSVHLGMRCE